MLNTPVLLIIFNRPDVTRMVFERLREVKPSRLYVAADGPRTDRANEKVLCEETRKIIEGVDWNCEVYKLYQESNLGCGRAVSGAISWFFEKEEMGIILEDDILPDKSFFGYCTELLEKYRFDESVMHINGCNFQQGQHRGDGSYYFSAFPHVWGWASWRRAWQHYDFNLSDLNFFYNRGVLEHYFKPRKIVNTWYEIFFKMNRKWLDTWDYQWNYAIWRKNGKVVAPNVNMISNIGFGPAATHTTEANHKFANLPTVALTNIVHPSHEEIDKSADLFTFDYCN